MYFCTLPISIIIKLPIRYIEYVYVGIHVLKHGDDKA